MLLKAITLFFTDTCCGIATFGTGFVLSFEVGQYAGGCFAADVGHAVFEAVGISDASGADFAFSLACGGACGDNFGMFFEQFCAGQGTEMLV